MIKLLCGSHIEIAESEATLHKLALSGHDRGLSSDCIRSANTQGSRQNQKRDPRRWENDRNQDQGNIVGPD